VTLEYRGQVMPPGTRFDAFERDALELINTDQATPFNLEDPADRSLDDILAGVAPEPPALPPVPPVAISPTSADLSSIASSNTFDVVLTGPGESGTWTVDQDASETWLTVSSPILPQSVDGTVSYSVTANDGPERITHMYVNGKTFTVTQAGAAAARMR
jgi:hypothetical protein